MPGFIQIIHMNLFFGDVYLADYQLLFLWTYFCVNEI